MRVIVGFAAAHYALAVAVGIASGLGTDYRRLFLALLIAWMAVYLVQFNYSRARGYRRLPLRIQLVLVGTGLLIAVLANVLVWLNPALTAHPTGRVLFSLSLWVPFGIYGFAFARQLPPTPGVTTPPR